MWVGIRRCPTAAGLTAANEAANLPPPQLLASLSSSSRASTMDGAGFVTWTAGLADPENANQIIPCSEWVWA